MVKAELTDLHAFSGLAVIFQDFPGLSSPGKCQSKIPGLSKISRTHTNTVILVNCNRGNRGQYFHDWFRSEVFSIQFYFLANAMVSFVMFLGSLRLHCFAVEDCMLPVVKLKFITNKQISYMLEREKPASNDAFKCKHISRQGLCGWVAKHRNF